MFTSRITIILICLHCYLLASGLGDFRMTDQIEEAYDLIIQLQFEEGQQLLDQIKEEDPSNLLVYHIENYIDFFKVFIGEREEDLDSFKHNMDFRLKQLKKGDTSSPYYLFSQAEVQLQWALARSKFDQYFRAGLDINRAYKLLRKNEERFPDFVLNNKSLALIHSLVGSIKGIKKGLITIFTSLEGSQSLGLAQIELLQMQQESTVSVFAKEIRTIGALMALHVAKDGQSAYQIINHPEIREFSSPLLAFIRSSIAIQEGKNIEGIAILEEVDLTEGHPFHYLHLVLGREKLKLMDPTAKEHLLAFINGYGGSNYVKEAYQKLAWHSLLIENDHEGYHKWMKLCRIKGKNTLGEDQQAHKEAGRKKTPHVSLLRSRLLFDGRQFEESMAILDGIDNATLTEDGIIEKEYRKARIYQMTERIDEAINHFGWVYNNGSRSESYFACNAALQMGILFYNKKEDKRALKYLKLCLITDPKEFKNSLHQKAHSWIEKIEGESP